MDDLPTESPATPASPSDDILPPHGSAPRSRMRMLWFRAVTTTLLVAAALTVLLAREDPTIFDAAYERLFLVVSPPSTQAAPTPIATFDLKTALPILQQRSLRVSALAAGATCVAAPGRQVSPDLGPALGDGPIYLVGYGTEGTNTIYMGRDDGGWYYLKTLWTAPPDFHDVFLLRGRQVDGPNEVRSGKIPPPHPIFRPSYPQSLCLAVRRQAGYPGSTMCVCVLLAATASMWMVRTLATSFASRSLTLPTRPRG